MDPAAIIQLITTAIPLVSNVFLLIKDKATGQMSAVMILDSADAQLQANQQAILAWAAAHPDAPLGVKTVTTITTTGGTGTPAA